MRTKEERTLFAIGLVCAVAAALIPMLAAPGFLGIYRSFSAELPLVTRLFVDYAAVFWLLPVLVVLTWFSWPRPGRALASCLAGAIGLGVAAPATFFALYLPIFQLAEGG